MSGTGVTQKGVLQLFPPIKADSSFTQDAWQVVRYLMAGALLGTVVAALALLLVPPEYEATGIVRIGQIDGQPVESSLAAIQRLRLTSVHENVATRMHFERESREFKLFRTSLRVSQIRPADLLEVRVRAHSKESVRKLIAELASELIGVHRQLLQPTVARVDVELKQAQTALSRTEHSRTELDRLSLESRSLKASERFPELVLLASVAASRDQQVANLERLISQLNDKSAPTRTFESALLGPPDVADQAVFPRPSAFLTVGLFVGLFGGGGVYFVRRRGHFPELR